MRSTRTPLLHARHGKFRKIQGPDGGPGARGPRLLESLNGFAVECDGLFECAMQKRVQWTVWSWLIASVTALAMAMPAFAATALSADVDPGADCTARADLNLAWTGAGLHEEFGVASDRNGSNIGTFGPSSSANNDWNGLYAIPITTAQPAGSLIGSYAWVGTNPPTPATAIEFFVVYNCSTRTVLFRCFGPYASCPTTVAAALALLPRPSIPAASVQMLVAAITLISLCGAAMLRKRA